MSNCQNICHINRVTLSLTVKGVGWGTCPISSPVPHCSALQLSWVRRCLAESSPSAVESPRWWRTFPHPPANTQCHPNMKNKSRQKIKPCNILTCLKFIKVSLCAYLHASVLEHTTIGLFTTTINSVIRLHVYRSWKNSGRALTLNWPTESFHNQSTFPLPWYCPWICSSQHAQPAFMGPRCKDWFSRILQFS